MNMNFFVLIKSEVDKGEAFPAVISFKSKGVPAGKQLATQMFKMLMLNRGPYSKAMIISVKKEKKDNNTFAVFGMSEGQEVDEAAKKTAVEWLVRLASFNVKIDDKEDDVESPVASEAHVLPQSTGTDLY